MQGEIAKGKLITRHQYHRETYTLKSKGISRQKIVMKPSLEDVKLPSAGMELSPAGTKRKLDESADAFAVSSILNLNSSIQPLQPTFFSTRPITSTAELISAASSRRSLHSMKSVKLDKVSDEETAVQSLLFLSSSRPINKSTFFASDITPTAELISAASSSLSLNAIERNFAEKRHPSPFVEDSMDVLVSLPSKN